MVYNIPQIPPVTQYQFTLPAMGTISGSLDVGKSIKDQPDGTITSKKQAYDEAVAHAESTYQTDMVNYQQKHEAAVASAKEAEQQIKHPRLMKALAISALALCIIGAVGIIAASIVTQTWPILFAAIPFMVGSIPSGIYTNIFCNKVSELEDTIAAPKKMPVPVMKSVPHYQLYRDLDLRSSRIDAVNSLARKTIQQLAESEWSTAEILNYGLLDGAKGLLTASSRQGFYAKSIQLIDYYHSVCSAQNQTSAKIRAKYRDLSQQLDRWKSQQDAQIRHREHDISEREWSQRREIQVQREHHEVRPLYNVINSFDIGWSRADLESYKTKVATSYGAATSDIEHWYSDANAKLACDAVRAKQNLEQQYQMAKQQHA